LSEHNFKKLVADNRIWRGKQGGSIPQIKRFLSEVKQGVTPQNFWPYEEVGQLRATTNREATVLPKRESRSEKGIPFSLECALLSGRRVRVIRGC
jgi:adenine-specific DNA-methyltransferase